MKMDSINISLPQTMADFVRGVVARDYGNASEFFRELVREKMRREIEADMKLLEDTTKGAPPGPTEEDIELVLKIQKQVRKDLLARRR
jgi:Arc/MetJ-type ribon-helix-helix transcriptional regulator